MSTAQIAPSSPNHTPTGEPRRSLVHHETGPGPSSAAGRELYDAFLAGDRDRWRRTTSVEIVRDGQHEMLNWFCLVGAMDELGLGLQWSEMIETDVFNSNKVFAIFE